MWHKEYRDYPLDKPLVHESVEPGKGLVGCEMHEINGWGNTLHEYAKKKRRPSFFRRMLNALFGKSKTKDDSHGK